MDFFNSLLPTIEHFRFLGYWIVLLILLIDSTAFIGLISPGTLLTVGIGFLSAQKFLDVGDVIWFATVGAILGDIISYYAGRHTGKKFFKDENRFFKAKYLKIGQSFFDKYGNKAILLDRFIGPVRPIATFVAGMSNMDKKTFILWSAISSFSWVIIFIFVGYLFGQVIDTITVWLTRGGMFLLSLVFFVGIFYILKWIVIKKGKQFFLFFLSIWSSIKVAITDNPDVKKFIVKHSLFFQFIKARLNKEKFWGLPMTLLAVSFIYTLSLLGGIVEDVVTSDIIVSVDTRIMNLLVLFRNTDLTQLFLWITLLGKWQVVLGFLVAGVGILWAWRKGRYILPLLITVAGAEIFTAISKVIFHRPRPELAIYVEKSFSFPSGHATIAVAFYGFLTYILIRHFTKWKTKVNIFFVGLAIILLIGFSRLYLGVHYVSDVWGGYLVGALWLIIGISISEWIYSWRKKDTTFILTKRTQIISTILILLSLGSYVLFSLNYNPPLKQQQTISQEKSVQNVMNIFTDEQLKYTETLTGTRQEPLSFIILASNDKEFITAFEKSGWYLADNASVQSLTKIAETAILKKQYLNAPMTPSFWDKKPHTFGFEKPTKINNVRQRHHARFWKTGYKTQDDKIIYVGTASLDSGIKWGVTHTIDPSIDTEREFLFNDLKNASTIQSIQKEPFVKPAIGENFSGDQFFTDGEVYILVLK